MTDFGNPFGVDLATTLFGAGVTLLLSGAALRYGGGAMVGVGILFDPCSRRRGSGRSSSHSRR